RGPRIGERLTMETVRALGLSHRVAWVGAIVATLALGSPALVYAQGNGEYVLGPVDAGARYSVAMDSQGRPCIAYQSGGWSSNPCLVFATKVNGRWTDEIAASGTPGLSSPANASIAIFQDLVYVAHYDLVNHSVGVATRASDGHWSDAVFDRTAD